MKSYYSTKHGTCYLGDSLDVLREMSADSVNLIMTSPPFALRRKKEYGNVDADLYVEWFVPFAREFQRILTEEGSLVIDIGGSWNNGLPTRSLYQYRLLLALCDEVGFHLAQDFFWYNPAKLPSPAEWVTVRRIRVKDSVNHIWWLSKTPWPKASNRTVLQPYSESMLDLLENGYKTKVRPSGHDISENFNKNNGGSIPSNLLSIAHTESNSFYLRACRKAGMKPHPARYPREMPEFFIKLLTDREELVLDPFAGSNVTGEAAERLGRSWISVELREDYLRGSAFRFGIEMPGTSSADPESGPSSLALDPAAAARKRG